ncbi:MAG: formate dehydrogenase subunit gamma [Thiolinea sp.]
MHKLLLGLLLIVLLPFSVQLHAATPDGEMMQQQDPGAELWNAVRGRVAADPGQVRTQVRGVDNTVLVNRDGEDWMKFRMEQLIPNAAKLLGFVALAIIVFRLVRGKIPIKSGRSTQKIKRFSAFQRYVHWTTAILFVALGLTGIALLFGRYIIIPVFGSAVGGDLMLGLKAIHDYAGPLFAVALAVLVLTFMKGNFAHFSDIKWIFKGGGLFGGHAPAGRYNAGEKGWYWIAAIVGSVVVVSGLVLDLPNFPVVAEWVSGFIPVVDQSRNTISYYHWIHGIAAVAIMAAAMGHIYMGTIAMEGAFEPMQTGYCDANWAKEHHDLWYEEMVEKGLILDADAIPGQHSPSQQPAESVHGNPAT